ncbi:peptidoglycan editing factor PgeF [Granulosicoccaceae sp. 1_MG-2023]|nr:peptidoglycan editing factor PgeF [Granulosicoccaceae sp. 1_MG-2023]
MAEADSHYLPVDWPAPANVQAWQTTRAGGVSEGGYASLNLGANVADSPENVAANRARMVAALNMPAEPAWIRLVHGTRVLSVTGPVQDAEADAVYTDRPGLPLFIPTADCLPVLLASQDGQEIAGAHAGWRGLAGGVIENTVAEFRASPSRLLAWLGPAIGPAHFEVGEDVFRAFVSVHAENARAFVPAAQPGKYFADIFELGRLALHRAGVTAVYGGGVCTYSDERFFSYRRQGSESGRMASLIWIAPR